MTRMRIVLLGILLLSLVGYGIQFRMAQAEARATEEQALRYAQAMEREREKWQQSARLAAMSPAPDSSQFEIPAAYPRGVSDWQARERSFHAKLLASGRFDALVVPFQVTGAGFDRPTRALMTAELSLAVSRATQWKLPDPHLVAKALGEGRRQLNPKDVYGLADAIGARQIIWGHAGHDRQGQMTVLVRRQERPAGNPAQGAVGDWAQAGHGTWQRLTGIPMPPDTAPIEVYASRLPEIMKAVGLELADAGGTRSIAALDLKELGQTPASLIAEADNPARDAYAFLLYAALVPRHMERAREVFAEKAYLALLRLAPESPEYRALRARTLLALGTREAALRVLAAPLNDEESGVLAYANGNLIELQHAASREQHPLKRLLLKLDENMLATRYGLRNQRQSLAEVEAMKLPGDYWQHLVARAFVDGDHWAQFDNAMPKYLMDIGYPIQGFALEEMVKGQLSLGDPSKMEAIVDRSFVEHARRLYDADPGRWCCSVASGRLGHHDYLELLLGIGHDNLLRRIQFYSVVQGNATGAIGFANSIDAIYKGHPYYELMRSKAELAQAKNASAAEREGLLKSAYQRAFDAMYWEQGQSLISDMAADQISRIGRQDYGRYGNFYHADRPFRPYYWTWADGGNLKTQTDNRLAAASNATHEFYAVSQLYDLYQQYSPDDGRAAGLLKSIEGRFNGAPQKNELLADAALSQGDRQAAMAHYRSNAERLPGHWNSIFQWGKLLYQEGEVREAARVWRMYAGFRKGSDENRVSISNHAYEVGSFFYWSGHLDLAEPFYRISAAQNTGASSDISSATRLRLMESDLGEALAGTLRRARRYGDTYAYRDYLGMLHAAGHSQEAWAGFSQLVRDMPKLPHVWETAMVGHRREGVSDAELIAWAQRPEHLNAGPQANAGAVYLLRFATTDRIPSAELAEAIQSIDGPIWQLQSPDKYVVRPSADGSTASILGPDAMGGQAMLPLGMYAAAQKQRVRSNLAYFAAAHRELKLKNLPAAKAIFDEAAALYDLTAQSSFMLPYYAYVQLQTGGRQAVEHLLARVKPKQQGFDYFLARAALDLADGRKDDALKHVARARYSRPHTEARPLLTQYTFGEFVELLADQSGEARLREIALAWVKTFQKIEPWQAWSYAMEARLGKSATDRGRAMAMAHYLDPGSERLSRLRKQDVQQAVKTWGKAQPFVLERRQKPGKNEDI